MPATIDATVGGAAANSYVTEAEAAAYFDEHVNGATWTSASTDARIRALISATRRIDQEQFDGQRASEAQALAWPRGGAIDADGFGVATDVIPQPVKRAQMELALELISTPDLLQDSGLEAFGHVSIGPLAVTPRTDRQAGSLPAHVRRFLAPFLAVGGSGVRLVRG